jgi:hypothetical protein
MTDLDVDELIARSVRSIGADAELPPDALDRVLARSRRQSRSRRLAVGATAAATVLVVGGAVAVGQAGSAGSEPRPLSQPTPGGDIAGLTGKDVGDALGLEALTTPDEILEKCSPGELAEYDEGKGFCLQGMSGLEAMLLGYQIEGHPRTPELVEYLRLSGKRDRDDAPESGSSGLVERLEELSRTLERQKRDAQQPG